jgi:multidrug resistance protein
MSVSQEADNGLEPVAATTRIPYWRLVFDHAGITPEVRDYPYAGSGTTEDPYLVHWIPHDPRNPMDFSVVKRWGITLTVAMTTLAVALVSSAYTGGIDEIMEEFHISQEVGTLGVSLFVLGFAIGPLLWAPLSELFGRQMLFFGTYAALTAFNCGCAGAKNAWTLIILRFFAGAFGSSPLTNSGGVIADMFPASQRGLAMSLFAAAPSMGPVLGPIIGGFLGMSAGWRWVMGFLGAFSGALWIIGTLLVPETYAPVLLRKRAAKLSQMTGKVYLSKSDHERGKISLANSLNIALSRPWILLFTEPIVLLLSVYMAIIYGTLYMLFGAFPIVFQQERGWNQGVGGLSFVGVAVGMIIAIVYTIPDNKRYIRVEERNGGVAPPEARLPPCLVGSIALPIGLFWFAWTNSPSIHWMASISAGVPFGFAMVIVFLSIMNYLIDSYTIFAASVLAANAVLRSLFGAAFPLFTTYMYKNLGIHWASSIPAFLALVCVPFPFVFYKYGASIRKKCKFAAESAAFMQRIRDGEGGGAEATEKEDEPGARGPESALDVRASSDEDMSAYSHLAPAPSRASRASGRARPLTRTKSISYEGNPYEIDRVHTRDSFSR